MKFKTEWLKDIVRFRNHIKYDELDPPVEFIEERIDVVSTYCIHRSTVFKHRGEFFLTEFTTKGDQYSDVFEDEGEEIECAQVFKKTKIIEVASYEPIKD